MNRQFLERLGMRWPIVGFSHSARTVAAISQAGGLGVFGAANLTPDELDRELTWLHDALQGRPYGVDVLIPSKSAAADHVGEADIPQANREFVSSLMKRFGVPEPPAHTLDRHSRAQISSPELGRELAGVALSHSPRLLACALGPAPADVIEQAHERDVVVVGMVGQVRHGERHLAVGADAVVAVGTEAGGHTGEIATTVLVPQVVEALEPVPVLAAGGIATGRQVAAVLALGATAAWTGSVWLPCETSEVAETIKSKLLAASSLDTQRSRWGTGRPVRQLRTPWVAAWDEPGAPAALPSPLQGMLVQEASTSMRINELDELTPYPVGQIVGMLKEATTTSQVFEGMVAELDRTLGSLSVIRDELYPVAS